MRGSMEPLFGKPFSQNPTTRPVSRRGLTRADRSSRIRASFRAERPDQAAIRPSGSRADRGRRGGFQRMASNRICVALLAAMAAALAGCSKSEDSAPDRKVFGAPPKILSATVDQNEESISGDWQIPFDG